ncbi:hypothetical protein PSU4_46360 [Pseudonocardia sulfidoxydans NBRC 16205]|uniref:Uncharacterized protein n=1 Tax=Pseudonocardia sulfidoxydans NBRC 16205 TaxID=1223511 RepID=A0A511DLJ4_9PSEU|nr:hypothetical protein [Pseudonocardia sulfidoxydans]GEL25682.1 hypothetical protein PSU4_46360 [Pseudonocardia sulfidoxydans NBRC 16205]
MENEDRARRHAELAETHIADDDAAGQASLAAYYASLETNELLRQLLSQRSSTPPRPMPRIPPDEPDLPGRERPPLSPPLRPPPPRPGLPPEM